MSFKYIHKKEKTYVECLKESWIFASTQYSYDVALKFFYTIFTVFYESFLASYDLESYEFAQLIFLTSFITCFFKSFVSFFFYYPVFI